MEAIKREKPLQFNKKAHEVQHSSFNQSVEGRLRDAEPNLAKAAWLLSEGPAKEVVVRAQQDLTTNLSPPEADMHSRPIRVRVGRRRRV